jgi:hypothetical protein
MLANILAMLLGLGSFTFYIAAFFYPEVHRRSDLVWSALGLSYALVLWFCAGQITGIVLLGQLVAVSLLLGLGWQTLSLRREKTPIYQQTPVSITPEVVGDWAKNKLNQLRIAPAEPIPARLEKRTFKEFSTDRLSTDKRDPRRRPLYDYEFVEDGLPEQAALSPASESQTLAPSSNQGDITEELDDTYTDPPAAVATILSITPEPEVSASQSETSKPEVSELEAVKSEPPEASQAVEAVESEAPEASELEADDWNGIDLENYSRVQSTDKQRVQKPTDKPKPNLLTMPLVLAGWVKDVVSSFTRPKPSKPVIDIPRRDPSIKMTQPPRLQERPQKRPQERIENLEDLEDLSEESNWDD